MIDLRRTWLPQIISCAEELHDGRLKRAWAEGDRSSTAYYSGELYEQVFDDLDSDSMVAEARLALGHYPALISALESFLLSLKQLDAWIEEHVDTSTWGLGKERPATVPGIFLSDEWRAAQGSAAALVSASGEAGFSSSDFERAP
jgi:hypothetical protein